MKLTDLRPGYLYEFLYRLEFDSLNADKKWEEELDNQKNDNMSDICKEDMEDIVKFFNEEVMEDEKIDSKYIWGPAPKGYFEKLGKKLLEDNFDSLSGISYKVVKVIERIHDKKALNYRYAIGFRLYVENGAPDALECIPLPYGGIYCVKKYAYMVLPLLAHLGLDIIKFDYNYKIELSSDLEKGITDYVQEYIDCNSLYRFGHAVTEIKLLQYTYDPLKVENAPAGKGVFFERRIEEMQEDYYVRKLMKIAGKVNPVWGENFWIPGDDEE